MKPGRSANAQRGIYRALLLLYPPSFRREYGSLMVQAFSDRVKERGGVRAWILIAGDLSLSVPQQILEVSLMSQKWMPALAAVGCCLILTTFVIGTGPPLFLLAGVGLVLAAAGFISMWAAKKNGKGAEFSYRLDAPKKWTWWTILAVVLAVAYVVAATGQLIETPKGTNVGALGVAVGFAFFIALGLTLRSRERALGNWLVVLAAVPALAFFWIIVPAVVGVAVIVGAVADVSRTPKEAAAAG